MFEPIATSLLVMFACIMLMLLAVGMVILVWVISSDLVQWIYDYLFSCWDEATMHWTSFSEIPPNHRRHLSIDVSKKVNSLLLELIKAKYCREVLKIQLFDEEQFNERLESLRRLEKAYPEMSRSYSPTRIGYWCENSAIAAFGVNEWYTLKRTLELLRPETTVKLYPEYDYSDYGEG